VGVINKRQQTAIQGTTSREKKKKKKKKKKRYSREIAGANRTSSQYVPPLWYAEEIVG
jgi:hypothetical protein